MNQNERNKIGVQQSGYIHEQRPTDFLAGSLPFEERVKSSDWKDYLPEGEQQNNPFVFDTQSCVTFSLMNSVETQLAQMSLSPAFKKFLRDNGYYKNGKINFSDKFIAILSGTTKNGNSYVRVADTIRAYGLIPDSVLPFKAETTWEQWHAASQITPAMLELGQKFLKFASFGYEWVIENNSNGRIEAEEKKELERHLMHAPLNIAVPKPATHAILMPSYYKVFDSYSPFYKDGTKKINYAFKFVVNENVQPATPAPTPAVSTYKYFTDAEFKKFGITDEDFRRKLDNARGLATAWLQSTTGDRTKQTPIKITSGKRTEAQNDAAGGVEDSAHTKGIAIDLSCSTGEQRVALVYGFLAAGITRIGLYDKHMHVDTDYTKPNPTIFLGGASH